jgi:hypothetical protein
MPVVLCVVSIETQRTEKRASARHLVSVKVSQMNPAV